MLCNDIIKWVEVYVYFLRLLKKPSGHEMKKVPLFKKWMNGREYLMGKNDKRWMAFTTMTLM